MKSITMYKDEVSGNVFKTKKEAIASEKKHKGIKDIFKWVPDTAKLTTKKGESSCDFANGYWCVQWNKAMYDRLIGSIIKAMPLYEPLILKDYTKGKKLLPQDVSGGSWLGRYLSDVGSPLYDWWTRQYCICTKCYREYGQPYYAINCHCDGTSGDSLPAKKIPVRAIY